MRVPVAPGWVEALVGTAVKLVLYYWESGSLVRKSITKVAQGDWMLGRVTESPGFSQQVFVLAYILYIIPFHCFHLLTCSNLKSWVKESRTLKWAHVNKWAAGRIPDNLLWHAGDLRETSLRASKGFGWLLHILLPFQVEGQEVQYKLDETLWCHKILSPVEVVNQIIENNERKHLPCPGRKDWSTGAVWYLRIKRYFCRTSCL